jgi:ABC-type Fe3+-hydroxamate transport system substrate-binding protein
MITLTDQMGRVVTLPHPPKRIISTVPSQTELLYYLGLSNEIAGITKFCTHPHDQVVHKLKIGGTKQLNIPLIKSLKPDLIIANKEENERSQLEELMVDFPTYISDPYNLPTALQMINDIGILTLRNKEASLLSDAITDAFNTLPIYNRPLRAAYFIWRKPYMVAGKGTFIDDMLEHCGFTNVFEQTRYPEITVEDLVNARPEVILLSSEPYPFRHKHADELAQILPNTPIELVDGELFSWYGSRLLYSPQYFITLRDNLKRKDM